MRRLLPLVLAPALVGLWAATARAEALSAEEQLRLASGQAVVRAQELRAGRGRYVGGTAYEVVDSPAEETAALLDDVASWRRFLPRTRDVRRVGEIGGDALVEVTHGSTLLRVAYTLRTRREGDTVRFWLDRGRTHDIEDAWGYLRAQPLPGGRTLLTWGILVDMGPGLLRDLFESRVQALCLTVPERVRDLLYERAAAGRRASAP